MRGARTVVLTAALLFISAAATGGCGTPSATDAPPAATTGSTQTTTTLAPAPGSALDLLAALAVRTADPVAPYVRDAAFGDDWDYDPATGCNVRELVLIDESLVDPHPDEKCRSTSGRWRSLYDGRETSDPSDLQIDHFIPLADAWRSGADTWTADRRHAFANDRTSPDTLIAVTGSTNESKGDSTPDQWLPPDDGAWCPYAQRWVEVKARWGLSVTEPERMRLAELLAAC